MGELLIFGILAIAYYMAVVHAGNTWGKVAEELGLGYSNKLLDVRRLYGNLRGFDVDITQKADGKQRNKLVAKIHGVNPGFTLGQDSALQRMVKPDIEIGDQIFDERTRIVGDADRALAVLGEQTRRLTEIVISGWNGELKQGVLSATFSDLDRAGSTLETMLDLAQQLRWPPDKEIPALLTERAHHDSSQGVRLQAFRQLSFSFANREETFAAAEGLVNSPSAGLRLEACRVLLRAKPVQSSLGAKGLIDLATRHHVASSIRRSALESLTESRHRQSGIPVMTELLSQPDLASVVRRAALEGLIRAKAKDELLEIRPDGEAEAETLARGLGLFDVSVQPRLIQMLEDSGDRARMAAVRSLQRVGDLDSILALRQVAGQGILFRSALAKAAEQAIGEIKERAGGSQQGEISLAALAPLEGAISPSDDSEAGGEVSLTS